MSLYNNQFSFLLSRLAERGPEHKTAGICYNLTEGLPWEQQIEAERWLESAFAELKVDGWYPVPNPYDDDRTPEQAYDHHEDVWSGRYGENRYHLLQLLIALANGWKPTTKYTVEWPYPPLYGDNE